MNSYQAHMRRYGVDYESRTKNMIRQSLTFFGGLKCHDEALSSA